MDFKNVYFFLKSLTKFLCQRENHRQFEVFAAKDKKIKVTFCGRFISGIRAKQIDFFCMIFQSDWFYDFFDSVYGENFV